MSQPPPSPAPSPCGSGVSATDTCALARSLLTGSLRQPRHQVWCAPPVVAQSRHTVVPGLPTLPSATVERRPGRPYTVVHVSPIAWVIVMPSSRAHAAGSGSGADAGGSQVQRVVSISPTLRIGSIKMKQSRSSQRTSSDCILVRKEPSFPFLSLTWVLTGGTYGPQR